MLKSCYKKVVWNIIIKITLLLLKLTRCQPLLMLSKMNVVTNSEWIKNEFVDLFEIDY